MPHAPHTLTADLIGSRDPQKDQHMAEPNHRPRNDRRVCGEGENEERPSEEKSEVADTYCRRTQQHAVPKHLFASAGITRAVILTCERDRRLSEGVQYEVTKELKIDRCRRTGNRI